MKTPLNHLKRLLSTKNLLFASLFFTVLSCQQKENAEFVLFEGTATPVPDSKVLADVPIWTKHAKMFIYAPVFEFEGIEGAKAYKYKMIASDSLTYSFEAGQSNVPLSPVWEQIPVGTVVLSVIALNDSGDSIGLAGQKRFYRSLPFQGVTNSQKKPYANAAYDALKYIYNLPHVQEWATSTKPDLDYIYYAYPSKIISATIDAMLLYSDNAQTSKEDSVKAMTIALNMARHLEYLSNSKHPLLKSFPATYDVEFYEERLKDTVKYPPGRPHVSYVYNNVMGKNNSHKIMLLYGYEYANMLLKLYNRTENEKYLDIVKDIAASYKKLQLPDGSWYLNINYQTTEPINPNKMIPGNLMILYKELEDEYGITGYKDVIAKADKWIKENPLKTFNWEGQFEDIPSYDEPYRNLSKYPPTDYAIYLLRYQPSKKNIAIAKELIRFAEDQFVVWGESPKDKLIHRYFKKDFHTPSVLEQYNYYVPIDASACQMIETYLEIFKVTKDSVYFKKAEALTNSITEQQTENGEIYTVWHDKGPFRQNWLNCMNHSVNMLQYFDEMKQD